MRSRTTCAIATNRRPSWLLGLALLLLQSAANPAHADGGAFDDALALLAEMEQAWSQVDDYTKLVEKTERLVNGDVTQQTVFVKFRRPNQYYMIVLAGPNEDGELIYPAREGSDLAVAHAGGFRGGLARFLQKTVILRNVVPTEFRLDDASLGEWQHQTADDASIGATIDRIAGNVRRAIEYREGEIGVANECDEDDNCLIRLDFSFPTGVGETHRVEDGQTLWSIGEAYGRPMYTLWYANPDVRGPRKLETGQSLFIPRYYAARGSVWVSPQRLLPTRIDIFDANDELYERYVYAEVRLNVGLTDADFDPENPDYRF
jgi:outer membrane lipoprotein-sorting protein